MDYSIILETKRKFKFFTFIIALLILGIMGLFLFWGIYGYILSAGFLMCLAITPLLLKKNKLFILLWITVFPVLNIFYSQLSLGPINLPTFIITGLSLPYALIIFFEKTCELTKKFDFLFYLFAFEMLLFLNIFRGSHLIEYVHMLRFYFILFFLVGVTYLHIKSENKTDFIYKCILSVGFTNSIITILQKLSGIGVLIIEGFPRVAGIFPHPNQCGFFINLYLPLCLYLLLKSKDKNQKIFYTFNIIITILALILTVSKTSYLIFLLNLFIFINLYGSIKTKFKIYMSIPIIITMFFLFDSILNLNITNNIIGRFEDTRSMTWRLDVWIGLLKNMDIGKFLFGAGISTADPYVAIISGSGAGVHNGYLQLIYELGIFGLSFIAIIIAIFIKSLNFLLKNILSNEKIYGLVPLMVSNVLLVETFFDQTLQSRYNLYLFIVIATIFYIKINKFEGDSKNKVLTCEINEV